ncbi:MAG: methyl-accepting chemotaxis protein, partial [Syntrophobacteraceae bacterium]
GMEAVVSGMLAHKAGVDSYIFEGLQKIAGFAPVELTGWSVAVTQPADEFLAPVNAIRNGILLVGSAFLGLTIILVLFFARSISRPIARVVEGLNECADQVAAASSEVSSSSESLAEGTSEQAASIEETSSSLEEMSSMTKQNAQHAGQANSLMAETSAVVSRANNSMGELTASMIEISKSSEETSKIIKTIDEIAFQTNLLALNAAVEAARAGEAGAGFAVVADEVRNLALRAADAAKNTTNLIEGALRQIKQGSEIAGKTRAEFLQVTANSTKMSELVGEIAAASNEQAQGIEQVNKAVGEMDKVVQQNAANAEESASASEEMNAQAHHMKVFVEDLVTIVGGKTNGAARKTGIGRWTDREQKARDRQPGNTAQPDGMPVKIASRANKGNSSLKTASTSIDGKPQNLIPFDDAEVGDF